MRKVIDLECDLPPDEAGNPRKILAYDNPLGFAEGDRLAEIDPDHGFGNYKNIFTASRGKGGEKKKKEGMSVEAFVKKMDEGGVERGVIGRAPNSVIAEFMKKAPDRFIGLASLSPYDGMRGVREFERLIKEDGLSGLRFSALYNNIPASDARYYPYYAKCVELDVPIRIYAGMNYANDRAYDLGHPRHIDQICCHFPELRVVAGLSGWPWANETTALLRRHPNLYADTASHRPRHFGTPGGGWEMFMQFGNTLNQDKIMVGLSHENFGMTFQAVIAEYENLPLKPAVLEKWLYGNAKRFFKLD